MLAILKILLTLAVIVTLLNRKTKMRYAMLAGSAMLFLSSGPEPTKLTIAIGNTLLSYSTWEILFALYFVMCLEFQLRTSGTIDGLMNAARSLFKSDRVLLAMMPAFLGFLPSLGGAIFSAPLVESASKSFLLSAEAKTTINYWFRHVWEYSNPIFTGMLLASQISGISLGNLISHMVWLTGLSIAVGWLFLITPIRESSLTVASAPKTAEPDPDRRFIFLATAPILANLVLVVIFHFSAAVSMGLVVAAMALVLKQTKPQLKSMARHALDGNLLWGIAAILFFQHVLRQSGLLQEVALFLDTMNIPAVVAIGIIAFVSGLLTGTSQGFVAISFPFISAISPGDLTLAMIAFTLGTAGQMLSPAHLCLLVTLDYFRASFFKSLRPVFVMNIIMIAAAYAVSM